MKEYGSCNSGLPRECKGQPLARPEKLGMACTGLQASAGFCKAVHHRLKLAAACTASENAGLLRLSRSHEKHANLTTGTDICTVMQAHRVDCRGFCNILACMTTKGRRSDQSKRSFAAATMHFAKVSTAWPLLACAFQLRYIG